MPKHDIANRTIMINLISSIDQSSGTTSWINYKKVPFCQLYFVEVI